MSVETAKQTLPPSFPIVWKGEANYEEARVGRVFNNRRPDRYPLAVVEATSEEHIVEAVRLARTLGCRVSVRSGGHSWAAWSVRDEAILVDLGRMHAFAYEPATGIAVVSPSTTGRLLRALLEPHGRLFPGGHCPEVALGGFLLQGGMGWNCKNWGWACERVLAVDIVTADGERVHCDANQNSDLYWAARGSGPGFPAIVTRFHLQTLPAFTNMRCSAYTYRKEDYRRAFKWILELAPTYDAGTEIACVSRYMPGEPDVCFFILLVVFSNNEEDARAALQPAEDSAPPGKLENISWFCRPTSLAEQYDDQHSANPSGHRYCVDNCYVNNDVDVVSVLEPAFTTLPDRRAFSLWYAMAPGSRRSVATGTMADMALSLQTDHYFATYAVWADESKDASCKDWVRNVMRRIERHSEGSYLGDSDFQVRRSPYWETAAGKRLMKIRQERDPHGRVAGYLDEGDRSGVKGLANEHEWVESVPVNGQSSL